MNGDRVAFDGIKMARWRISSAFATNGMRCRRRREIYDAGCPIWAEAVLLRTVRGFGESQRRGCLR